MPKIDIELTPELVKAIKDNKGALSMSEFIEQGMKTHMSKGKLKLNTEGLKKQWSP